MRSRLLILVAALTLGLTALVGVGCGDDDEDTSTSEDTEATTDTGSTEDLGLIADGVLTVGTDTPFPPFEIGQPPNISGYDIDVLNAAAEELGLTTEYTDTSFDTIFRDVASGQFDIAAAASTITPGRQKTVDFSDPYYEAQQALLVPEGSDIATTADLADAIVGAQDGTTGRDIRQRRDGCFRGPGLPRGPRRRRGARQRPGGRGDHRPARRRRRG